MSDEQTERLLRVQDLVSPYCDDNPDEATAGLVRSAKVAHQMFFQEAGGQCVQVATLLKSNIRDRRSIVALLSELYARAVFETAFALYFDRQDAKSDAAVLANIEEAYSPEMAMEVHRNVQARGVVLMSALGAGPFARTAPRASEPYRCANCAELRRELVNTQAELIELRAEYVTPEGEGDSPESVSGAVTVGPGEHLEASR